MATIQRTRERGKHNTQRLLQQLAMELREARLTAGVSQQRVGAASGLSQPIVSRIEHAWPGVSVEALVMLSAALGLRLSMKVFPEGSPVRDAGQLRLIERLRTQLHPSWRSATEMLEGASGDYRAWDLHLSGPGTVGIDAETRLHDLQALQRRCNAKSRDSGVDRVVLLVADSHHNRRVLHEHRAALRSSFPLDTRVIMAALRAGELPIQSGIAFL